MVERSSTTVLFLCESQEVPLLSVVRNTTVTVESAIYCSSRSAAVLLVPMSETSFAPVSAGLIVLPSLHASNSCLGSISTNFDQLGRKNANESPLVEPCA